MTWLAILVVLTGLGYISNARRRANEARVTQREYVPDFDRPAGPFPFEQIHVSALPFPERHRQEHTHHFRVTLSSGDIAYFGCSPGDESVNVFVRSSATAPYDCHGFSIARQDWAYDAHVDGARELRDHIDTLQMWGLAGDGR